jgi:hypothetical protein
VGDRLGNAEEHQPYPHPDAEHHGDPGHRFELRTIIVPSQPDPAVAGKGQKDHEDQKSKGREYEYPAEVRYQEAQDRRGDHREIVREEYSPKDEYRGDSKRNTEYATVNRRIHRASHPHPPFLNTLHPQRGMPQEHALL